jgi:hypothetical protein
MFDNLLVSGRIDVRVTPRSSRERVEVEGDVVRAWTTTPPTDGLANEAVRKLLAKRLGIAPSRLTLVRGATSRQKTFEIDGVTSEEAWSLLAGS